MDRYWKMSFRLPIRYILLVELVLLDCLSVSLQGFCETMCVADQSEVKQETPPILHGEGPHWDDELQVLYFVNQFEPSVLCYNPSTRKVTKTVLKKYGDSVGVIIPLIDKVNQYVVAVDRTLYLLEWNVENESAVGTVLKEISSVDQDKPKNQCNDGKADNNGRLWIGTLTRDDDFGVTKEDGGSLYEISKEKSTVFLRNLHISNGLCWSRNNKVFYFIDSTKRNVMAYDFNLERGTIENGKIVFDLKNYPDVEGNPDGMVLDNKGNLWIALYGGSAVINVDPTRGKLLKKVDIPAKFVTSLAFGGPDYKVLYITTSRMKLSEEELQKYPKSGAILSVSDLGVHGYPDFRCNLD